MDRNVVIMFMECIYMKKIILLILSFFVITNVKAIELPKKTDHETVVIYLFRGKDCSHCHDALTWFSENLTRYEEYIEVRSYEVYQNQKNGMKDEYGFTVIGNWKIIPEFAGLFLVRADYFEKFYAVWYN